MSMDLHTLSGAYSIDALSDDEARLFDTHLEGCQACRDEVRELQDAAATMGASEAVAAPAALRARILAAADQHAQLPPRVTSLDAVRSRRRLPQLVAAAAAVLLVITGGVLVAQRQLDDSNPPAATSVVFQAKDARTASVDTGHGRLVVAISPSLGQVAVETDQLQSPGSRKVYQMWTVHSGTMTNAGTLDDLDAGKVMAMPSAGTTVAITIEPDGGSSQPTSKPIVTLDPRKV